MSAYDGNDGGKEQSVTYRYRDFFIFLVVSEPVSEQIGTKKSTGLGIEKI